METRSDYRYEVYDTPEVRHIRIPQQDWADGAPYLGANGLPVAQGVVRWFDLNAGIGLIVLKCNKWTSDGTTTLKYPLKDLIFIVCRSWCRHEHDSIKSGSRGTEERP